MAEQLKMPALSSSITEAKLIKWHKNVGDSFLCGELLAEIATDNSKLEIFCPFDGILLNICVSEGQSIGVTETLAYLDRFEEESDTVLKLPNSNNQSSKDSKTKTSGISKVQHYTVICCCLLFALSNILVPVCLGDIYPFTIAPMFRDTPLSYANYRIFSPDGTKLADNSRRAIDPATSPDPFKLRRYYDGNPVGCGVGICPPVTLGDFGTVHQESFVRKHIVKNWPKELELPFIEVEQEIVGPINAQEVGVQQRIRWRIERPTEQYQEK